MNVPIMIASQMVTSNGINGGFAYALHNDIDKNIKRLFIFLSCVFFLTMSLVVFEILNQIFKIETKTIIEAKVVQSIVEPKKKSNGYREFIIFKIDVNGKTWKSSEKIIFSQCRNVIYDKIKPISITHHKSWTFDYYETSGMVTFCQ